MMSAASEGLIVLDRCGLAVVSSAAYEREAYVCLTDSNLSDE